jgi:hypothetical protein
MQFIPMIWSLIFLNLGYAMTMDKGVLPVRIRRVMSAVEKGSVVLVVIGFFVYLNNFESRSLAQKYGMRIYAKDQARDRFAGFFDPSIRKDWEYGTYRWFSKRGAVYIFGGGKVGLKFYCLTPALKDGPIVLKVFHNGRVLDEIVFSEEKALARSKRKKGKKKRLGYTVKRKYDLPLTPGKEHELLLEVSRTWIPHEVLANFDRRKLGVGVRILGEDGALKKEN